MYTTQKSLGCTSDIACILPRQWLGLHSTASTLNRRSRRRPPPRSASLARLRAAAPPAAPYAAPRPWSWLPQRSTPWTQAPSSPSSPRHAATAVVHGVPRHTNAGWLLCPPALASHSLCSLLSRARPRRLHLGRSPAPPRAVSPHIHVCPDTGWLPCFGRQDTQDRLHGPTSTGCPSASSPLRTAPPGPASPCACRLPQAGFTSPRPPSRQPGTRSGPPRPRSHARARRLLPRRLQPPRARWLAVAAPVRLVAGRVLCTGSSTRRVLLPG